MNLHPMMSQETQILFDLVSVESFSGNEQAASEVFVHHAKNIGFDAHVDEVGNAIAHRGASPDQAHIHIVLLGHIDTVPGDIPVRIADGILHGRGAVDAKGPLAAMLVGASQAQLPAGVRLSVAGAVGEEASGSIGARHLVKQWQPDACIIGEPSAADGVTLGYKGRLLARTTATVPNTHSAGKDPSASDELFAWWNAVLGFVESFNAVPERAFDQVQASIESMSSTCDGLIQSATMMGGFRLPPSILPEKFADRLRARASDHLSISFDGAECAHETDRNDPVVRALSLGIRSQGLRPRPKLKTGTSDMNVVAPIWQCPIAAYGPGDSALDHTPIEHLRLDEYQSAIRVLKSAVASLATELIERQACNLGSVEPAERAHGPTGEPTDPTRERAWMGRSASPHGP